MYLSGSLNKKPCMNKTCHATFWKPPFATCPMLFGGETDLPGRPQRNGEVDAGDRSLALKMQAWCLQREGVLPPTVQLATGGGWVEGDGFYVTISC